MLIDSHCHLNHEDIRTLGTPGQIMDVARQAGVGGALTICCRIVEDLPEIQEITRTIPNVWGTIGTHPHDAARPEEQAISLEELTHLVTTTPKIVGIGETGLDYYYDLSPREVQQDMFRKHIRAARVTGLPLIIHARDADEDMIRILKEEGAGTDPSVRGVMHCFSSGSWLAQQALAIGFYLSFSGILTFKKAEELRAIAQGVPLDRLLVETDAPYLAPEPWRGKVNQPAYVMQMAKLLADIKKMDKEDIISICNKNFFSLFNKAEMGT